MAAVQEFLLGVPLPRAVTSTSIVLLPKRESPSTFADYRPISLCNVPNKIMTKILCSRMQSLLPKLISPEQVAFVPGRDIVDNVLLVQELLQHLDRKVRGHNLLLKLDIMKAFDMVNWNFLKQLLLKFGFCPCFVQLIFNNLQGAWFSVLVNGVSSGFFQASRGLKQGDPLSPYLFILVAEAFGRGLKFLVSEGAVQQFALPRQAIPISYLAFADDLILFTRASGASVVYGAR